MNYGEKHYIEIGKNLSAKNAVIMRMPMWMLQKLFCSAAWMDWESIWMLYRESLGNRIKVRPRSLLEDRENHPRWWVSLGTLREFQQLELLEGSLSDRLSAFTALN